MKGCIGYKKYWLPKCAEIKFLNCVDPPSRNDLAMLVFRRMEQEFSTGNEPFNSSFRRTAYEISKKPPSPEWLIAMLATMEPSNPIFAKDYVKPKVSCVDGEDLDMVENTDGWFDGLPMAVKSGKKQTTVKFADGAASDAQKLKKMQM